MVNHRRQSTALTWKVFDPHSISTAFSHIHGLGSSRMYVLNFTRCVCEPTSFCFHCCVNLWFVLTSTVYSFCVVYVLEVVGIYLDSLSLSHLYSIVFSHWTMLDIVHTDSTHVQDEHTTLTFFPGLVPQVSKNSSFSS